ncbi:MAG: OmpH family outer membrane protein [bacterium]|nr:OmpH family outer membrane protein [bacterium]
MKKIIGIIILIFSIWVLGNARELKLAYINSQQIMAEFQESIDVQKIIEQEDAEYEKKLKVMENEIKTLQESLEKQGAMLSEEKRQARINEITTKMENYEKFRRETWGPQGKLYQRQEELTKPVLDKVNAVIKRIGEEEGYDFIFDIVPGAIVYAKPADDITQRILDELQKK